MSKKTSGTIGKVLRCIAFIMLGLLLPWQWLSMQLLTHAVVDRKPMLVPERTWESFAYAWLAIHAYCVGYIIWGGLWRKLTSSEPLGSARRWLLVRMAAGAALLVTAYVFLVRAIVASW